MDYERTEEQDAQIAYLTMVEHHEFVCPSCGCDRFGTVNCTSPVSQQVGHCHGSGCQFQWPRTKDHLVFRPRYWDLALKLCEVAALLDECRRKYPSIQRSKEMITLIDAALAPPEVRTVYGMTECS